MTTRGLYIDMFGTENFSKMKNISDVLCRADIYHHDMLY